MPDLAPVTVLAHARERIRDAMNILPPSPEAVEACRRMHAVEDMLRRLAVTLAHRED